MVGRKKKNKMQGSKVGRWIGSTVAAIAGIGVGGGFVDGLFESVPILEIFGPLIHDIVGWVIIGGTLIAYFAPLFDGK